MKILRSNLEKSGIFKPDRPSLVIIGVIVLSVIMWLVGSACASGQTLPGMPGINQLLPPVPTNAPPTVSTFLPSMLEYFTSFDTNSTTFTGHTVDAWIGADYVNGINTAQSLGMEWDLYHLSTNGISLSAETVTRNAGIAGTILNEQLGMGFNLTHYDTKLTLFVDGGYDFNMEKAYAAIGARIKKATTANTFMGISIEEHIGFSGSQIPQVPTFGVFAGAMLH